MRPTFHIRRRLGFEPLEFRTLLAVFTFQDGVYPDASYAGTRDTQIRQDTANTKYGSATSLNVDGDEPAGSGKDVAALLKWDVSSMTPGTPVQTATITLNVTNDSGGQTYSIYEVKREWVEGETAWNNWASGVPWQTAGAQGANDRGSTAIGTASPSAIGAYMITLNGSGTALVSQWINSPDTNYGLIIAGSTTTNGFDFSSREHATAANRPKLTIDTGTGGPGADPLPVVSAGPNTAVWLPRFANLDGTVTDNGTVTAAWSFIDSMPTGGNVVFGSTSLVDTTASFTLPTLPAGDVSARFTLRLTATDDANQVVQSDVQIDVVKDFGTVTFAAMGDWGDDYETEPAQSCDTPDNAEDAVSALIDGWDPQFIIGLGDHNYSRSGTQPCTLKYDTTVGTYYHQYIGNYGPPLGGAGPGSAVNRFFPSKGNHEWQADGLTAIDYADYFTLPGIPIPAGFRDEINNPSHERYYRFTWGPIEFFALSSDTAEGDGTSSTSTQGLWLQNALGASTALWKVVYFHHQPYSSGGTVAEPDGNVRMRWPFKVWGADVVLSGHRHNYERIVHDDDPTDADINEIPYFVVGIGGTSLEGYGAKVSGSQKQFNTDYGALRVQVTSNTMTLELFDKDGGAAVDTHVITKNAVVPKHATWKYLDNGSNQGTAWQGTGFNDASWASGPAQLGYSGTGSGQEFDEVTKVNCGPTNPTCTSGNFITTYFRKSFTVTDPARFSSLTLNLLRDDGAVVYLNGNSTPLVSSNMPGTFNYTTPASTNVGAPAESTFFPFTGLPNSLVSGTNVLAVEVHQFSATSGDVSFDLELIGVDTTAPKVNKVIIGSSTANATSHPDCDFSANGNCKVGNGEQLRTVPVAAADEMKIQFSEKVALSSWDLDPIGSTAATSGGGKGYDLADPIAGTPQVPAFSYDATTNTATWRIDTDSDNATIPYIRDQLVLHLLDEVRDIAGNRLDGEWDNPTDLADSSSDTFGTGGDGTAGGTFNFHLTLLPGDVNRDNQVTGSGTSSDTWAVLTHWGQTGVGWNEGDMSGDTNVGNADLSLVQTNLNTNYTTWPTGGTMGPMGGGGGGGGGESFRDSVLNFLATDHSLSPAAVDEILKWLDENAPGG